MEKTYSELLGRSLTLADHLKASAVRLRNAYASGTVEQGNIESFYRQMQSTWTTVGRLSTLPAAELNALAAAQIPPDSRPVDAAQMLADTYAAGQDIRIWIDTQLVTKPVGFLDGDVIYPSYSQSELSGLDPLLEVLITAIG